VVAVAACATLPASAAADSKAFFPGVPPATQITQDVPFDRAAQLGLIKLQAKGGSEGDAVSLELTGKTVHGPINVTLRVELTVAPGLTPPQREALRDLIPYTQQQTEAELNRREHRTSAGDRVRFVLDWRWREPEEPPRTNYHQVLIVDPTRDLAEPDPEFRSRILGDIVPNSTQALTGTFSTGSLDPIVLAHESLHLAGLDDRYGDVYRVQGKDYPLPANGMKPSDLKAYLRAHRPPLPPPPAGRVTAKNRPGTDRCDQMGIGSDLPCRDISTRDLDWLAQYTGVQVTAKPGDLLLNKDPTRQNFGIAFETTVFASPGSTTVANGIAVYCLDHDRFFPLDQGFDVGPPRPSCRATRASSRCSSSTGACRRRWTTRSPGCRPRSGT
jgi:hypothetical protein